MPPARGALCLIVVCCRFGSFLGEVERGCTPLRESGARCGDNGVRRHGGAVVRWVRCGAVWCGAVWCAGNGAVWCGVVRCGAVVRTPLVPLGVQGGFSRLCGAMSSM